MISPLLFLSWNDDAGELEVVDVKVLGCRCPLLSFNVDDLSFLHSLTFLVDCHIVCCLKATIQQLGKTNRRFGN